MFFLFFFCFFPVRVKEIDQKVMERTLTYGEHERLLSKLLKKITNLTVYYRYLTSVYYLTIFWHLSLNFAFALFN